MVKFNKEYSLIVESVLYLPGIYCAYFCKPINIGGYVTWKFDLQGSISLTDLSLFWGLNLLQVIAG